MKMSIGKNLNLDNQFLHIYSVSINCLLLTMKLLSVVTVKVVSLCMLLFLSSCFFKKTKETQDIGQLKQLQLPDWVIDPSVTGYVSAVGIAPKTAGGIKMQIAQAEADAMGNMAAQIQTTVSRVTKESIRRAGVATGGTNNEAVDDYFAQATKSLVKNVPISGAKRKNIYQSPQDGVLYIQMILDQTVVKEYLANASSMVAGGMANFNATQKTIASTERAMKDLFNELDFSKSEKSDVKSESASQ